MALLPPNYALKLTGGPRRAGRPAVAARSSSAVAALIVLPISCPRPAGSLTLIRYAAARLHQHSVTTNLQ